MRIQHNITALNAHRQLGNNNNSVSKNLEKLSSGFRINRAGDDAAGLAISEKMRAQITGLDTAQKNANDGISLVQTAEGALTEVHSMLNRMVELADQSANGTYQNEVDRENLQKEVNSLRSEINRISESTNFNGINLLDGSINASKGAIEVGTITSTTVNEAKAPAIGTFAPTTNVDGKLNPAEDETKYSAKFYVGDITNNNAAGKDIVLSYKDNTGATQTVTMTVAAGADFNTADIATALAGGVDSQGTDANGKFEDLYDVTVDGNIVTITAKAHGTTFDAASHVDGSKLGIEAAGFDATAFDAADRNASIDKMKEKYDGTTESPIGYGTAAGEATSYVAAKDPSYQVASKKLTIDSTSTGSSLHNGAITVGSKMYVIQNGTEALKGLEGKTEGTDYEVVKVDATDSANDVASKLAAKISADEPDNGKYVASAAANVLTISESTNKAQEVLTANDPALAGKASAVTSDPGLIITAGTTTGAGTLATFDANKMVNGTSVTVGDKTYTFVTSDSDTVAKGAEKILYKDTDKSEDLAKLLADKLTADGKTGVAADGTSVKVTGSTNVLANATTQGAGLTLQIGDTSDSFNKLSVQIGSTSAKALGIDAIDIETQSGAASAVAVIKKAINSVSSTRGDLGAIQNRLEHTINNLSVTSENMTAAESRIRDVDMAKEMMTYTKNNILVQASQAMLAQANQLPQGVLQLLR